MTEKEKQEMMLEVMQVVNKHIEKADKNNHYYSKEKMEEGLNKISEDTTKSKYKSRNMYGREFGISDEAMAKWKEEYRKMPSMHQILESVRGKLVSDKTITEYGLTSFDLEAQARLIK